MYLVEQTGFLPEGTEIIGEPFEETVRKVRNSLAFQFSALTMAAEVVVTDGKRSATFSIGSRDYDLDSRFTGDPSIRFEDAPKLEVLARQLAAHKPARAFRSQELPKGIVPIGAEAEELISITPELQLKIQRVRMPYGQGKPVNYYEKRKAV